MISTGYEIDPYDPCVTNKIINGKKHAITLHVHDLTASHMDLKLNDLLDCTKIGTVWVVKAIRALLNLLFNLWEMHNLVVRAIVLQERNLNLALRQESELWRIDIPVQEKNTGVRKARQDKISPN